MKTIYKYSIPLWGATQKSFHIPNEAVLRSAAKEMIDGEAVVSMWFEVDTDRSTVKRTFAMVGTGHALSGYELMYVGTVIASPLVIHVYEVPNPKEN